MFRNHILNICKKKKKDLALNDLWWLICHKTKPNHTEQKQWICFANNPQNLVDEILCTGEIAILKFNKKSVTVVESDLKAPFHSYYIEVLGRAITPFPGLLHFILDMYLIMLSVMQRGIKYHFFFYSLLYDSNWDWISVSWAIGEHSTPQIGCSLR